MHSSQMCNYLLYTLATCFKMRYCQPNSCCTASHCTSSSSVSRFKFCILYINHVRHTEPTNINGIWYLFFSLISPYIFRLVGGSVLFFFNHMPLSLQVMNTHTLYCRNKSVTLNWSIMLNKNVDLSQKFTLLSENASTSMHTTRVAICQGN
jgi:hypothetical protein